MSNDKEAARFLNSFARENRALLGSCDDPALAEFISDYFCGDDPIDSDGELWVYKAGCTLPNGINFQTNWWKMPTSCPVLTVSIKTMND